MKLLKNTLLHQISTQISHVYCIKLYPFFKIYFNFLIWFLVFILGLSVICICGMLQKKVLYKLKSCTSSLQVKYTALLAAGKLVIIFLKTGKNCKISIQEIALPLPNTSITTGPPPKLNFLPYLLQINNFFILFVLGFCNRTLKGNYFLQDCDHPCQSARSEYLSRK